MYAATALTVFLLMTQFSARAAGDISQKNILILGDSITAGYGVDRDKAFPSLLQDKIDGMGWSDKVINAGVSGDTSADGLRRLKWIIRQPVDILVLELGANDGLRGVPVESTRMNLQAIVTTVRERFPTALILIAGMRLPPNFGDTYTDNFRKMFQDLAGKNQATLIPFLLEGVGGVPGLNQQDRIHPNELGHRIVAETVWKALRPALEDMHGAPAPGK